LYWSADRDLTASLVERAEAAGYGAIVLTLDTPLLGWRERDLERGYLPFLDGEGLANYFLDSVFRDALDQPPEENPVAAAMHFTDVFADPSLTWDDLGWLRERTDLPIVLKGILSPEDARLAAEHAEGLIVSNHGGRQVNGAIGAIEALPGVIEAIEESEHDCTTLFDSGIRRGADAIRAIALGADAVLLGRPYVYGLALGGEDGVEAVVKNFRADLDLTLGLCGCASVREVDRFCVIDASDR
jgi:isopentenyl-diphosphate delta-isomerase